MNNILRQTCFWDPVLGVNKETIVNKKGEVLKEKEVTLTHLPHYYKLHSGNAMFGCTYLCIEMTQNAHNDPYWEVVWETRDHYLKRVTIKREESLMNETFLELADLMTNHRKDNSFNADEIFSLLYKYWEAECGEQELREDLSYLIDSEFLFEALQYIRICDPSELEGKLAVGYQTYVKEINE